MTNRGKISSLIEPTIIASSASKSFGTRIRVMGGESGVQLRERLPTIIVTRKMLGCAPSAPPYVVIYNQVGHIGNF